MVNEDAASNYLNLSCSLGFRGLLATQEAYLHPPLGGLLILKCDFVMHLLTDVVAIPLHRSTFGSLVCCIEHVLPVRVCSCLPLLGSCSREDFDGVARKAKIPGWMQVAPGRM